MDVHETLKQLGQYFKEKILAGDYEFIEADQHTATIKIDGEFRFELWVANEPKENFGVYFSRAFSDQDIESTLIQKYMKFTSQKERLAGWRKLKPYLEEVRTKTIEREKQKLLNRLKQLENGTNQRFIH